MFRLRMWQRTRKRREENWWICQSGFSLFLFSCSSTNPSLNPWAKYRLKPHLDLEFVERKVKWICEHNSVSLHFAPFFFSLCKFPQNRWSHHAIMNLWMKMYRVKSKIMELVNPVSQIQDPNTSFAARSFIHMVSYALYSQKSDSRWAKTLC